jgi:hypothetical protein
MMRESRRQKAESSEQKAAQGGSVFTAYCLLPTAFFLFLRVSVSPTGRALLAGALLISAYVLVRYWRSLNGRSRRVSCTLVGLRATTFLLIAFALSGVEIEYESKTAARVLLSYAHAGSTEVENVKASGPDEKAAAQIAAMLKARGFEVASDEDSGSNSLSDDESFVAATLLTDGAMSSAEAGREVWRLSKRVGVAPVYVVADSSHNEGASVALENVTVLGRAMRGVPVSVRCDVHGRGMKGRESLVTISDDAKVQASARLVWTSDDERQSVTLALVPKVAGWIDYNAKVEAAGGDDEPSMLARPFSLYVEERRLRILFFESEPTWEGKFIRRALEQSGLFEVDYYAQVSRASTVGMSEEAGAQKEQQDAGAQPKEESRNGTATNGPAAKLHATLQSATQLNLYDCVMVGATENSLLSASEAAHLAAWVEQRGGGLIVLGGNSFNGSIAAPNGKLYSLLPAEISAQSFQTQAETISQGHPLEAEKTRGSFMLTPTEAGANGALEGYLRASEDSGTKAATLTGQGLKLGALRPGANVLAVAGQPDVRGTSEVGAALVAARRIGAGRMLLFAPADSWRVRATESGAEDQAGGTFAALWQGLVLWTGAGARPSVEVFLNNDSPAEMSAVTMELRARDAISFSPQKIEELNARLQPLTENANETSLAQVREMAFAPDVSDSSIWRARFFAPPRGRYALEVDYVAGGKKGSVEKYFAVVAQASEEPGAAFDALRRAARETGGDLIAPDEIDALAERLSSSSASRETVRRAWKMREWWPFAFFIPLLLSAEWFARRWWKEEQG